MTYVPFDLQRLHEWGNERSGNDTGVNANALVLCGESEEDLRVMI